MKRLAGLFWSLLFLLVPILGVITFAVAPAYDIWLPKDVSEHGAAVDGLFYFILGLTGVVFIATELCLFWFIWKYDEKNDKAEVKYRHGSHVLEVVWTVIPAAVLLFLAIYQMNTWADVKMRRPSMARLLKSLGDSSNGGFGTQGVTEFWVLLMTCIL